MLALNYVLSVNGLGIKNTIVRKGTLFRSHLSFEMLLGAYVVAQHYETLIFIF